MVASIDESSRRLAEMFMSALASVQFQDVTRQQIEQVIDALDRLDGHAGKLCDRLAQPDDPVGALPPLSEHLDRLYSGYVMQSQRDTHRSATGQAPAAEASGPKIELF